MTKVLFASLGLAAAATILWSRPAASAHDPAADRLAVLREISGRLDRIDRHLAAPARDSAALEQKLLAPSVQVTARGGVGGGTVIGLAPDADEAYVLTAFHVVQKVLEKDEEGRERRAPVQVRLYREPGGDPEQVDGDLVLYEERKDLALVKVPRSLPVVPARLAGLPRLRGMAVFSPIYTVGCPLGHDPMPSSGEITTLRKEVHGERFWMMNAPTIFGNSGGGVFDRASLEMIGVSAMICTYENPMSTPVPHLGILVPMDAVYDWLRASGYDFLAAPEP